MPTNKIQTGLRLPETTYGKLRTLSVRENRSLNNLMEDGIYFATQYLEAYEADHGPLSVFSEEE